MISLVAQCGICGVRWATGAVRNVQDLGFAVALLAKSVEQGAPICVNCSGKQGATASDVEVKQHDRAVELAKGTNLPECPYCEAKAADLDDVDDGPRCCEEGSELGWWDSTEAPRWHRRSLEERPS